MKRNIFRRLLIVFFAIVFIIPGSVFTYDPEVQAEEVPVFKDASVHDPSVISVNDSFYVFGSHLAAAKSEDFMQWERFASEVNPDNPLFENVVEELKETFDWAQSDTLWASDVIQLEDGKYYMYYNACKGDSPRSALGIAVADSVEGPYEDTGIILKSGMWDEISEDGTIYDAKIHPNTVDPDVFFDAEGKLWMMYGSYSGGIFILELDTETGKPIPDQGYGKKLLGGNHSRIEAPYVQYNPVTDYYYMYLSFGGLDSSGGYNMRVVRSENPDGPYYDAEGNDMINVKADPTLPIFDDASIEPYGVKLMGNFLFTREIGETGTGIGNGYVSPGHNSVYYDEETDEQYLIFHTRFPEKGEQHEVRVHKMHMNDKGWPVVSPYRYAGESLENVSESDISGEYKFINHGKDISSDIKESINVSLNNDGTISGEVNGTWELTGDNKAALKVDGSTYDGVFIRQWDPTSESYVMTFTASSNEGVSIWGSKTETKPDDEIVEAVKNDLDLGDTSNVISNLILPSEGLRQTEITWQSSNPEVVSEQGIVTRPTGVENVTVTLTATMTKGDRSATKTFSITVLPQKEGKLVAHYAFEDNLADSTDHVDPATVTGDKITNTGGSHSYVSGKVGQATVFDGASGIRLPDGLISSNQYTVSLWLKPDQITNFTTAFFGARNTENWLSFVPSGGDWVNNNTMIWSSSNGWYDANTNMKIKENEWSHVAFTVDNGELAIYFNGVKTFTGTEFSDIFTTTDAIFGLGVNYWDIPYKGLMDELLIYDAIALTEEEIISYYDSGEIPEVEVPDKIAPVTKHEIEGNENNGWYREPVTVSFTTEDNDSGVETTHYNLNEGAEQTGNSVKISEDGKHLLHYWSIDKAGNREEKKSVEINLDQTAPTITFSVKDDTKFGVDQEVNVTCLAEDALSGIASSSCKDMKTPAYQLGLGAYSIIADATDKAGNNSSASLNIMITVDYDSLVSLTEQFLAQSGDKNNNPKPFINKLDAAKSSEEMGKIHARNGQIGAYINQVKAKSDKGLTAEQAEVLIDLAESLLK
ncbi:lipocalin-like domain-containing protein [Metabacillus herbersteinensis]|uniref:Lipocalin-like domain-containing protein n=1 Tax=Metabacillus herbersteinensis TaxID=283816 RepID=A0ABV6GGG4_9BACI